MDQHTIPEFYLRGFLDPNAPAGQEPYLWFHTHPECKWRRRSPKNLSTLPNYYSVPGEGGKFDHAAEHFLQQIENDAAIVIREAINRDRIIDIAGRQALARFIASMWFRVPRLHSEVAPGMTSALLADARDSWLLLRDDASRRAAILSELKAAVGADLDVEAIMTRGGPVPTKCSMARHAVVQEVLGSTIIYASRIADMTWNWLVAQEPLFFATSDWPVSLWSPEHPHSNFQCGLGVSSVQLTFPVTKRVALFAEWGGHERGYLVAPPETVVSMNHRTARLAATIYSPAAGFPGFADIVLRPS
jgi:hypothetical protein